MWDQLLFGHCRMQTSRIIDVHWLYRGQHLKEDWRPMERIVFSIKSNKNFVKSKVAKIGCCGVELNQTNTMLKVETRRPLYHSTVIPFFVSHQLFALGRLHCPGLRIIDHYWGSPHHGSWTSTVSLFSNWRWHSAGIGFCWCDDTHLNKSRSIVGQGII
jgi:hypothetical protein